jgi:hypothetical protein
MACRGKSISDIGWFLIIMSVLLLFIGAGALWYCCQRDWCHWKLRSQLLQLLRRIGGCGAGLTARGFTYFQFAGWFGYYGYPNSARPWQNRQLWDWSGCCSMDVTVNKFFGLVSALFGYTVSSSSCTVQKLSRSPVSFDPVLPLPTSFKALGAIMNSCY